GLADDPAYRPADAGAALQRWETAAMAAFGAGWQRSSHLLLRRRLTAVPPHRDRNRRTGTGTGTLARARTASADTEGGGPPGSAAGGVWTDERGTSED